jgi:lysophospholipase L1-like esterase
VAVFSTATGKVLSHKLITGSPQSDGQPTGITLNSAPTTTKDTLKLVSHCLNCNDYAPRLTSLNVSGLGMDYPRGAVLVANTKAQPKPVPYAALGDSFSSGEGVRPFISGTDDAGYNVCHRSILAYANLINRNPWQAASLALPGGGFVACSGAKTTEITGRNDKNHEYPQVSYATSQTKVVTLTIGGNDVLFNDFATACLFNTCNKSTRAYKDTDGKIKKELPAKLKKVYTAILTKAVNTDVYISGYPQIAPNKSVHDKNDVRCPYLNDGDWHWEDARAARQILIDLDNVIATAVATTNTAWVKQHKGARKRLHYVDPLAKTSPFIGHTVCASPGVSYFNNLNEFLNGGKAFVLHPSWRGQAAFATLMTAQR